jgi:hypothetical protein
MRDERLRRFACILFASLIPLIGQGFSIFPQIKSTLVAGTTNRELARGIATDGTNFLVVYQGDNLFAGPDPTNQLAAQLVGPTGSLLGNRIDLAANGSVPLVEFGVSSFLAAWTEDGPNGPSIWGRFLDRSGNLSGPRFPIASNTSASEVGAMAFASDRFWIAWSQTNATNGGRIVLQQISPSAQALGAPLPVGLTDSPEQLFPALSVGNTNVLLAWTARRANSNVWDVIARFAEAGGNLSAAMQVNQAFADQPYPVAAACDRTNHLVVWSREAGPTRYISDGYGPNGYVFFASRFPATFGRFVNEQGMATQEVAVSHARFGQTAPAVAFDGTNYLIGWNDRRSAGYYPLYYYGGIPRSWARPVSTNQTLFFCFLSRSGTVVDWEFLGEVVPAIDFADLHGVRSRPFPARDFDRGERINSGPVMKVGRQSIAVLRNQRSENQQTNDVAVLPLTQPSRSVAQIKFSGVITNDPYSHGHPLPFVRVTVTCTNSHFLPQWSSNAVDWITPESRKFLYDDNPSDFIEYSDWWNWDEYILRYSPSMRFYRAVEVQYECVSNLRKLARLKEMAAYTNNFAGTDDATDMDLAFGYVPNKPSCPAGGTYVFGRMNQLPYCSVGPHNGR